MKITSFIFLSLMILGLGCARNQEGAECEKPIEYQTSPLAALMREMHDNLSTVRDQLELGQNPDSLPVFFDRILSAEATDPTDINDTYKALAASFLKARNQYNLSKIELKTQHYTYVIDACVSCHEVFCGGPMDKIKRLYPKLPSQNKP